MNAYPPPALVSRGPYAVVAHPIYLGFGLVAAGCAVGAGSAAGLWLVTPVAVLGCRGARPRVRGAGPRRALRRARPRPSCEPARDAGAARPSAGRPRRGVRPRPPSVARPLRSRPGARRRAGRRGPPAARRGRLARVGADGARVRVDLSLRGARSARGGDADGPPALHAARVGRDGARRVPVARAAGRGAAAPVRPARSARRSPRARAALRLARVRVPLVPRRVGASRRAALGAAPRARAARSRGRGPWPSR